MTRLSICIVPGARPEDAVNTVSHMLRSGRSDFEILLTDRSTGAPPSGKAAPPLADPRLRLLRPAPVHSSVAETWNQLLAEARGEWIIFIAEGDYADPDICELIEATLKRVPLADAIGWSRACFVARGERGGQEIARIATGTELRNVDQTEMMRRLFFWEGASNLPDCPFGVRHGALRRTLLDRIAEAFSGLAFEGDPAWDNACKTVLLAQSMVEWQRPMSVQKSSGAGHLSAMDRQSAEPAAAFPFAPALGETANAAQAIEAFKQRYGIELSGWHQNFISACVADCESASTVQEFKARRDQYAASIKTWLGKPALKDFQPEFKWRPGAAKFQGHVEATLYFDMGMGQPESAAEFYDVIDAMLFPVALLDSKLA